MTGFRKWSVAMAALAMAFILALKSMLTGDFVMVASVAVGAFTAGNAYEHSSKAAQ